MTREADPLDEEFLSTAEVAKLLGVSKMTVYRLIDTEEVFAVRVGRCHRVTKSSLRAWIRQGGSAPEALAGQQSRPNRRPDA